MKDRAHIYVNIQMDMDRVSELKVSFYQNGIPVIVKDYSELTLYPTGFIATLDSSDLAVFDMHQYVDVQAVITDCEGNKFFSGVLREHPDYLFKLYDKA